VTSKQLSLLPARSDDGTAPLGRFELAAGGVLQLGEALWTEVRQRVALEPSPEEFHRIELRCIGGQEMELNVASGREDIVAHQVAAMRPGAVPDDEQWSLKVRAKRLEEVHDLLFGNTHANP
jgi:hypothetical protein